MRLCANCGSPVKGDPVVSADGTLLYPPCPECTSTTLRPGPPGEPYSVNLPPSPDHGPFAPLPAREPYLSSQRETALIADLERRARAYQVAAEAHQINPNSHTAVALNAAGGKCRRAFERWHNFGLELARADAARAWQRLRATLRAQPHVQDTVAILAADPDGRRVLAHARQDWARRRFPAPFDTVTEAYKQ
jgi:hypothetical protein